MVQMLERKIQSVRYPMQELHLNYPTTKGKIYSEEEDRYLLCRLHYYGLNSDDVYERIKKDISEFPVFRFDWFFKSRTAVELQRRCATLLGMIAKEQDDEKPEKPEKPAKVKKEKVAAKKSTTEKKPVVSTRKDSAPVTKTRRSRKATAPLRGVSIVRDDDSLDESTSIAGFEGAAVLDSDGRFVVSSSFVQQERDLSKVATKYTVSFLILYLL